MSLIDSIITKGLPYLPRWFAKPFAKPYVAGETVDEALSKIKKLNTMGFSTTLDILGEHIEEYQQARDITSQYCMLYDHINKNSLDCTLSVKPTHVGLYISQSEAILNMTTIAKRASDFGNFLRIDMENSDFTDMTFNIYRECKAIYDNVGVAIQAYLHRSENDINILCNNQFNTRICKGIYSESSSIAYQNREDIRNNFLLLAKTAARIGGFCGYATHDQILIDMLLEWIKNEKISKHQFEFQALYGVPMDGRLDELIQKGFKVRIYVPFGPDWFDYSIRRLNENPNIAGYVISNLFKKYRFK
ncbi:MAG: proline dehydrogenase family protein [Candidatus Neomarinimicrobiota bacterium]